MYNLSQKNDTNWGIKQYDIPVNNFDHIKNIKNKENLEYILGKKKRLHKKISNKNTSLLTYAEKQTKNKPSPWSYDLNLSWSIGYKKIGQENILKNKSKILKSKWRYSNKEDDKLKFNKLSAELGKEVKLENKLKFIKKSYIDDIIAKNTKKKYPIPGPGSTYLDEKCINNHYKQIINSNKLKLPLKEIRESRPFKLYFLNN